ncbi:uncharacterized protein LOC123876212 [Maniola jurtina]|uniref:uncharacterized protein LOC123876212 n=1 Tax=Maniola jurtina TaxID=191418 RepID=UPI001E68EF62|nr:uncharacterized protein LOC123876212 [Maniola jurtina]
MSKRNIFPQQNGERKKAKLDLTVSDHNFPLSQNFGTGKDGDQGHTWGDDNDDEILLLASQACEDAYSEHSISVLPNYSICMQPTTTSTQLYEPVPSTSKAAFTFKKPTSTPLNTVTTKLKDKCERISSPLPGMSKVCKSDGMHINDDIILNDDISNQNSDHIYRQLLKLREENENLKSENGKLLEKCVTKEGEASILRTQLKTSQIAVDKVRLEKIQMQERVQMEWSEKLTGANKQMHDLRTQLEIKNLEIISMKEKCKMLESNKVKFTQVTVAGNDISMSQRNNNSYAGHNAVTPQFKKPKTTSSSAQTEEKSHFIQLNIPAREGPSKLTQILPLILPPTTDQYSILEYNDKLRQSSESKKCRIYSTFHRLPQTPRVCKDKEKIKKINLTRVYESLTKMAACGNWMVEDFLEVFTTTKELLRNVQCELETVNQHMTTAFQKEMDEKYIDVTSSLLLVDKLDLLSARPLYKEEQATLARRMTAVLVYILEDSRCKDIIHKLLQEEGSKKETDFVNILSKTCTLLDNTTCAILYSGLLLSITLILKEIISFTSSQKPIIEIVKTIILSRPMPFVITEILHLLSQIVSKKSVNEVCCQGIIGNLKMDSDQGVLLYRKDSCILQVMLKQIEGALKCTERGRKVEHAVYNTRNLILLYSSISCSYTDSQQERCRCDCQLVLMQVMVYGLNVCANMLNTEKYADNVQTDILSVCRSGVQLLYQCILRNVEFAFQLGHNEGHLLELCEILQGYKHSNIFNVMLSEITSTFQLAAEEQSATYHQEAWINSFQNFTVTD